MRDSRFLILGLDGLRADMVTPELTPNLLRLARRGVWFRQHHATFPTATRVNIASLVTGSHSGTHGVVNNSMFEPCLAPNKPVDLGKYEVVEAADAYYGGALFATPSLGEILAAQGETLVAISSGTTGSNRLMHHKIKSVGGIGFSAQGLAPCYPRSEAESILARFGPVPAAGTPDQARLAYITEVFLEHLFPLHQPRVTILWFSDPDRTHHYCGIGSSQGLEAIRAADAQLGRIMDWLQQPPQRDRLHLLVLSDHGLISVRQQVSVGQALTAAGFPAGRGCFGDGEVAIVPWANGAIHLRRHQPQLRRDIAVWLQEQPWCGCLFTAPKNHVEGVVPGTFARSLVLNEHARAGDILYVMRADAGVDDHGIPGGCYDDSHLPVGGATHGGLSRYELRNVCVAYGPAFLEGHCSVLPSGTVDILPTLLHLLGIDPPPRVEGRVLYEALREAPAYPESGPAAETFSTAARTAVGLYHQHLRLSRLGASTYLEQGWVE